LPVLDAPAQAPGLVIAAGFSGHGFCLGPVTGQIAADLALGRECRHPIAPFRLERFKHSDRQATDLTLHGGAVNVLATDHAAGDTRAQSS
jgi:sarcosine oxidase subunit beta